MAKIILIAPPSPFTDQLQSTFLSLGHDMVYVNDRSNYLVPSFLGQNRIAWKIIRKVGALRVRNNALFAKDILAIAQREKPDLIFINKGNLIFI